MITLVVSAVLGVSGSAFVRAPSVPGRQPTAATAIVDSARAAAAEFNWVWRFYWEASVLKSEIAAEWPPPPPDRLGPRLKNRTAMVFEDPRRRVMLHCHPNGEQFARPESNIIESGSGLRAICPSWPQSEGSTPFDERQDIDIQIRPELLPGLRAARDSLLDLLDRAGAAEPSDEWTVGERVRFALDQGDTNRAFAAAVGCTAQPGWCAGLRAYIRYERHDIVRADSEFQAAVRLLPHDERCVWTDLSTLVGNGAREYGNIPCDQRDSVNERIWWLSKPLYTEPANERRAAHYARVVEIRLRSTDTPAERWDWRDDYGGRAIRAMMLRYGQPAFSYWLGHDEDASHYHYLGIGPYIGQLVTLTAKEAEVMGAGMFTTAEYPLTRYHTVPTWRAIGDPWRAIDADWDVSPATVLDSGGVNVGVWPWEHTPHAAGPLVQLADEQTGLFRRESTIDMAVATDVHGTNLSRYPGERIDGVLIISPGPDQFRMQTQRCVVESTAVMRASLSGVPEVIGVEYPGRPTEPSARIRFGVSPPPTLSAMKPGEVAISSPVFVHASGDGDIPPTDPDVALPQMFGSTTFSSVRRVGIYWESYGVGAGDTVDVGLQIASRAVPGLFRRLVTKLGIGNGKPQSIALHWHEPSPGHGASKVAGPHPIQGRNVTVDLSDLEPGDYTLEVSMTRPGGVPVTASRNFTLIAK